MEDKPIDKVNIITKPLEVKIQLVNEKVHFIGESGSRTPIDIDYTSPLGDDLGYTSLELLLMSLASCSGSSILFLLRKMRKTITGLEVKANGIRRDQHPTSFKFINLEFRLKSQNTENSDMDKVLAYSEETYCPVWAMLKSNVEISTTYTIDQ